MSAFIKFNAVEGACYDEVRPKTTFQELKALKSTLKMKLSANLSSIAKSSLAADLNASQSNSNRNMKSVRMPES